MSHPISKVFNGGSGSGGFEIFGSFGVGAFGGSGSGFSVNELLERTRPKPKARTPLAPPPVIIRQPTPAPTTVEPVSFINDLLTNVVGGITGGSVRDINAQPQSGISNVVNDLILGQTTSRQERAVSGTPRAGDLFKTVTRDFRSPTTPIGIAPPTGGIPQIIDLARAQLDITPQLHVIPGGQSMAGVVNLVQPGTCPPGAQSFPPGTCLLDFQWEDAGGPRGFEMIGRNEDGRAILRKRGRRRRRRGLTKSQMGQISWACTLPAACRKETLHGIIHG